MGREVHPSETFGYKYPVSPVFSSPFLSSLWSANLASHANLANLGDMPDKFEVPFCFSILSGDLPTCGVVDIAWKRSFRNAT